MHTGRAGFLGLSSPFPPANPRARAEKGSGRRKKRVKSCECVCVNVRVSVYGEVFYPKAPGAGSCSVREGGPFSLGSPKAAVTSWVPGLHRGGPGHLRDALAEGKRAKRGLWGGRGAVFSH